MPVLDRTMRLGCVMMGSPRGEVGVGGRLGMRFAEP